MAPCTLGYPSNRTRPRPNREGTEMFWNDPDGAEVILQVRAASLCDDERFAKHLRSRAGCAFTRRPNSSILNRQIRT
jgi:hypothetical protein